MTSITKYLYNYFTGGDSVVGFILGALIVWAIVFGYLGYTTNHGYTYRQN